LALRFGGRVEISKILFVGVDSLAGCNLAVSWTDRCEVIGACEARNFSLDGCRIVPIDSFADAKSLQLLADERPQWIVHCGPASRSAWDWQDFDVDVEARQLAAVCIAAKRDG